MSNLNQVQFEAYPVDHPMGIHSVRAIKSGEEVGSLFWHQRGGKIENIHVYPEHRRQGIATAMFHEANKIAKENNLTAPKHSNMRTEAGDAWSKSIGGDLPKRRFCSICDSPRHTSSECPEKAQA